VNLSFRKEKSHEEHEKYFIRPGSQADRL
jgi:hypothetical protein